MLSNFFELEEVVLEYLEKAFVYCEPFWGIIGICKSNILEKNYLSER
jgi:hypothetical protein